MPRPAADWPTRRVCAVCSTSHQGRCTPPEARSVPLCLSLPPSVHTALCEAVPWGERSGWVARLIADELGVGRPPADVTPLTPAELWRENR